MPKRSKLEVEVLSGKAFNLLDEGWKPQAVALELGVSLRSVQRWIANRNSSDEGSQVELIAVADRAVVEAASVNQQVGDLLDYRDSQRLLATEMGSLASRLSSIAGKALDRLEESPEEITPRILAGILRAIAELSEKSSNCWARSTGLEEVLNAIQVVQEEFDLDWNRDAQ
jgi:predicted transcriptional regulator